jgi:hypothetical protein
MPILGKDIGVQLCEALGLVASLVIDIRPNKAVTVTVTRFVEPDSADGFVNELKRLATEYEFVERKTMPVDAEKAAVLPPSPSDQVRGY